MFDADGGKVDLEKKPVIPNDRYRSLPTPVRKGYDFLGWHTDSGDEITDDTIVSAEKTHTLYARWKKRMKKVMRIAMGTILKIIRQKMGNGIWKRQRYDYHFLPLFMTAAVNSLR